MINRSWALVLCGMVLVKRNYAFDKVYLENAFAAIKERKFPICKNVMGRVDGRVDYVCRRNPSPAKNSERGTFFGGGLNFNRVKGFLNREG
jgi:hypothetical protein